MYYLRDMKNIQETNMMLKEGKKRHLGLQGFPNLSDHTHHQTLVKYKTHTPGLPPDSGYHNLQDGVWWSVLNKRLR